MSWNKQKNDPNQKFPHIFIQSSHKQKQIKEKWIFHRTQSHKIFSMPNINPLFFIHKSRRQVLKQIMLVWIFFFVFLRFYDLSEINGKYRMLNKWKSSEKHVVFPKSQRENLCCSFLSREREKEAGTKLKMKPKAASDDSRTLCFARTSYIFLHSVWFPTLIVAVTKTS